MIDAAPLLSEECVCKKIYIAPQALDRIYYNILLRENPHTM